MHAIRVLSVLLVAVVGCGDASPDRASERGGARGELADRGDLNEGDRDDRPRELERGRGTEQLDDIRSGVQAWNDEAIGICRGRGHDCEEFIGTSTGELPPGEYMLRAELRVPKASPPGGWKIRFELECETTAGEQTSTRTTTKEYDVAYSGEEHGYRLSPLWSIVSPNPGGERHCEYTIVALHPDGGGNEWSGEWWLPAE